MERMNLNAKINTLPGDLKSEINDFVDFLIARRKTKVPNRTPKFGSGKGRIQLSNDFDEPLEDFKDYMF